MCTPSARPPIFFPNFDDIPGPLLENDGDNYLSWEHHTRSVLRIRGLWEIVNGSIPIPDPSAPPNERAEWLCQDQQACFQIMSTIKLGSEPSKTIVDTETAKECWDKLSVWYKRTWRPRIFSLFNEVFRSQFSDTEPLKPQIDALVEAAHKIRSLDMELDDRLVAFAILSSLPSLGTIILPTANLSDISTVRVTRLILDDEEFRKRRESDSAKAVKKGKGGRKMKPAKKY